MRSFFPAIVVVLIFMTNANASLSYPSYPYAYTQSYTPTQYTPRKHTSYSPRKHKKHGPKKHTYKPAKPTAYYYIPAKPTRYAPTKPTSYAPTKASSYKPAKPTAYYYVPAKPTRYAPVKSISYTPAKPTSYASTKASSYKPAKQISYAPATPISYEPELPVYYAPSKPTNYAPTKPVQTPAKPVNYAPDTPTGSNNGLADQFLAPQNAARAAVGLSPLVWDSTLATYAQWWANERRYDCALEHSNGRYGENIFWGGGSGFTPSQAANEWVAERSNYNYDDNSCSGEMCGHYTQIVWGTTTRIGCAKADCYYDLGVFMICSYDPPGNYVGQKPY